MKPKKKTIFVSKDSKISVMKAHSGGYEVYVRTIDGLSRFPIPACISAEALLAMGADLKPTPKKKAKKPELEVVRGDG